MKVLNRYRNGNYYVTIYDDGTKVRETEDNDFVAEFPENIDIKISNRCDLNCEYCHEESYINGKNAHFNHEFLSSLRAGTELAIGGGNVFTNPYLEDFLTFCRDKGIIANLTINQGHVFQIFNSNNKELIKSNLTTLYKNNLLNGVGISYNGDYGSLLKFYKWAKDKMNINNFVVHVINGVHSYDDIMKLANENIKILILGYKDVRKGVEFRKKENDQIMKNQKTIYKNIHEILKSFKVVSFDNLAIEQLNIRRLMTTEEWDEFYMGDEGNYTMYIDLVGEKFALNSCDVNNRHKLLPSIDMMFNVVKNNIK